MLIYIKKIWEYYQGLGTFNKLMVLTVILIILSTPFIVANRQIFNPRAAGECTTTYSGNVTMTGLDVAANETVCFDPSIRTKMELTGNAVVRGTLRMRPANAGISHTLRFVNIDESKYVGGDTMEPLSTDVGLWIIEGGIWDVQGAEKTAWLRASGALAKGASQITLESSPSGWRAGDELVFAATVPPSVANHFDAYDYPKVVSVSGSVVTLDRALTFEHPAVTVAAGKTMTAEVLNMTRNVRVEGQPGKRAHIIINHEARPQTIRYVELRYLGPQGPKDAGGNVTRVLGRYGLHFHMNHDGSRGSLIEGVTGRDMGNWMFVPHSSHGTTWRNVIGHNGFHAIFIWDDKSENASHDTLWERTVASRVTFIPSFRGYRINGFTLQKGDRNRLVDSAVFGVQGNKDASGVHWPEIGRPAPQWEIIKNVSHNQKVDGWFAWENSSRTHVFGEGSVIYHNGKMGIDHGAYGNKYQYQGVTIYGNGEGPIKLQAVSGASPNAYFERMLMDASGKEVAVKAVHHTPTASAYTTFFGEGCVFRGYTRAASAQEAASGGAIWIEVAPECRFEGTGVEAWIDTGAPTDTRIRLLGLGIELTHKSLCSNPSSRYNACVTPITVGPVQFDFNLDNTVSFMNIVQGGSAAQTILAGYIRGPAQQVTFSYKPTGGLNGTTGRFSPASCTPPCSTTMTVTTSGATKLGHEVFSVSATTGSLVRKADDINLITLAPGTASPTPFPNASLTPTPTRTPTPVPSGVPTPTPTKTPIPTPTRTPIPTPTPLPPSGLQIWTLDFTPKTPAQGQNITFEISIANFGNNPSPATTARFYDSSVEPDCNQSGWFAEVPISPLVPWSIDTKLFTKQGGFSTSGTHSVWVVIDEACETSKVKILITVTSLTPTPTRTPFPTAIPTNTPTPSVVLTPTPTPTRTPTPTATRTPTPAPPKAPTPTPPANPSDLQIWSLVPLPANPSRGQNITFEISVVNFGANISPSTTVRLYESSTQPNCSNQTGLFGEVPISPLVPWSIDTKLFTKLGGFSTFGAHTIWAFADGGCDAPESDENNNTQSIDVVVN